MCQNRNPVTISNGRLQELVGRLDAHMGKTILQWSLSRDIVEQSFDPYVIAIGFKVTEGYPTPHTRYISGSTAAEAIINALKRIEGRE